MLGPSLRMKKKCEYPPPPGFGLRFVCWFYDGNTQRLTESGFMEEPGIEPATPGLQDIGLSPTPRRLQIHIRGDDKSPDQ